MRPVQRPGHTRLEGTLFSPVLHAHRKRGLVLALGRYHLDLSVSVAVPDQPPLVMSGVKQRLLTENRELRTDYVGTCYIARLFCRSRHRIASADRHHRESSLY